MSGDAGNLGAIFKDGLNSIERHSDDMQAQMNEIFNQEEISQEDMLMLQFEMGQYNALLESLSSITSSMTEMLKTLAQRTS
ncbi:type III secretion protein [Deltaproteobacteria bacterium Smac51]|nr:type III secretion protein [Deltaproteobacteria bacterium Smac51]